MTESGASSITPRRALSVEQSPRFRLIISSPIALCTERRRTPPPAAAVGQWLFSGTTIYCWFSFRFCIAGNIDKPLQPRAFSSFGAAGTNSADIKQLYSYICDKNSPAKTRMPIFGIVVYTASSIFKDRGDSDDHDVKRKMQISSGTALAAGLYHWYNHVMQPDSYTSSYCFRLAVYRTMQTGEEFFSKPLRPEKSCYLGGWKCVLDITEMLEWKNPLYSLISASSFIDTYRMAQKWHFLYVLTSYALTSSNIGRFSTYLTVRIRRTFEIILSLKILPNLKCVAIPTHIKNSNRKQRVYCLSYYLK